MLIEAQRAQGDLDELHQDVNNSEHVSPMQQKYQRQDRSVFKHDKDLSPPLEPVSQPNNLRIRNYATTTTTQRTAHKELDKDLETYNEVIAKAYAPANQKVLLDKAKQSLDATELKLLILMLQMRGQFDS